MAEKKKVKKVKKSKVKKEKKVKQRVEVIPLEPCFLISAVSVRQVKGGFEIEVKRPRSPKTEKYLLNEADVLCVIKDKDGDYQVLAKFRPWPIEVEGEIVYSSKGVVIAK